MKFIVCLLIFFSNYLACSNIWHCYSITATQVLQNIKSLLFFRTSNNSVLKFVFNSVSYRFKLEAFLNTLCNVLKLYRINYLKNCSKKLFNKFVLKL